MRRLFMVALTGAGLFAGAAWAQDASQIDCSTAQTQVDLDSCARMDFEEADSNLNDAYKAAIARMQDLDKTATDKGAESSLREAQRTWVTFRDQACATEGWTVHGGSMEPMVVLECKARISASRADDLWSLSEDGG